MGILSWIAVGLIAGILAGKVREGGYGLIGDLAAGVLGGLSGGYLAVNILQNKQAVMGVTIESILVALCGAVLLLVGVRLLGSGRRRRISQMKSVDAGLPEKTPQDK